MWRRTEGAQDATSALAQLASSFDSERNVERRPCRRARHTRNEPGRHPGSSLLFSTASAAVPDVILISAANLTAQQRLTKMRLAFRSWSTIRPPLTHGILGRLRRRIDASAGARCRSVIQERPSSHRASVAVAFQSGEHGCSSRGYCSQKLSSRTLRHRAHCVGPWRWQEWARRSRVPSLRATAISLLPELVSL